MKLPTALATLMCLQTMLPTVLLAGPAEDEVIATFEVFCISNINTPEEVPKLLKPIDVEPLSNETAQPLLGGQEGTVWMLGKGSTKMALTLLSNGVCSLYGRDVQPDVTMELFERTFKNKKMSSEQVGSQIESMFAVSQADKAGGKDVHVLVLTNTSTLSSVPGIVINAMPESVIIESGITVPEWP